MAPSRAAAYRHHAQECLRLADLMTLVSMAQEQHRRTRCTVPGFPNEPAVKRGTRGGLGKAAITRVFIVISLPSRPNRRNMAGRGFMAMTRGIGANLSAFDRFAPRAPHRPSVHPGKCYRLRSRYCLVTLVRREFRLIAS